MEKILVEKLSNSKVNEKELFDFLESEVEISNDCFLQSYFTTRDEKKWVVERLNLLLNLCTMFDFNSDIIEKGKENINF